MIETGINNLLATTASIVALVGTRIYPVLLPEASPWPALTYQVVGGSSEQTLSSSGFQQLRVEFNCWSDRYLDAITLREAVSRALDGYQGLLSDGTLLQNVQMLQAVDFPYENDLRIFRAMVECYLYYDLP